MGRAKKNKPGRERDVRKRDPEADAALGTMLRSRGWVDFADDHGRIGNFQGPGDWILLWIPSSPGLGEGSMPTFVSTEPEGGIQVLFAFGLWKTAQIGMRFAGPDDLIGALHRVESFRAGDPSPIGSYQWGSSEM